ncbi:hypothetical protein [Sphingomonas sp.]|jgi:hypothetical protein|uniref:hypothetical protein n=1 Tax=Sphingomonas sp. TaxID=28214 RepID=UPI002E368A81|nr:hypothetical protein [Sphingomonas sp.]HEX4693747.1 hypothetical protein [Sphingomonas sp.]
MKQMVGGFLALCAGITAASAQAADAVKPCLTEAEAQAVFLAVAPDVMKAVAQKCEPSLPAAATLRGGLAAFLAPYDAAAAAAWPQAMPAIAKMAGPEAKGMDPALMKPMMGPMIGAMAGDAVKPKDCTTIDRAVTLLAPLPPANVAGLVVLAFSKASAKDGKAPFTICPVRAVVGAPIPK